MDKEFECFFRDLLVKTTATLEALPPKERSAAIVAASGEPFLRQDRLQAPRADKEAAARGLQASEKSRLAAMQGVLFTDRPDVEKSWRAQVQQRKLKERRQKEFEAALAAEQELQIALSAGSQPQPSSQRASPTRAAREMWAAEAQARVQERTLAEESRRHAEQQLLQDEWEPRLAQHKEAAKTRRQEERRLEEEATAQKEAMLKRERDAMAGEDFMSRSFLESAEEQCRVLALQPVHPAAVAAAEELIRQRLADQQFQREFEEKQRQVEAIRRVQEEEQKEREYRQWKEQVRVSRCTQHMEAGSKKVEPARGVEGLLQATVKSAEAEAKSLKERGGSPRRVLQKAKLMAEEQRRERDQKEPARQEQELWESLLAKNRLAKRQERGLKTPRWGLLMA